MYDNAKKNVFKSSSLRSTFGIFDDFGIRCDARGGGCGSGYRLKNLGYIPREFVLSTDVLNAIYCGFVCNY